MRALSLSAVAVLLVLPTGAAAAGEPPARTAATAAVEVGDFFFRPGYTRIEPGDTVTWRVAPGDIHTVTTRAGAPERFDSGDLLPGTTFSRPFPIAGRYPYLCSIHPEMRGVVQVGPDVVDPALRRVRARTGRRSARVSFGLSEASRVSASIASKARPRKVLRRAKGRRLQDGRRSLSIGTVGLAPGRYRVTVTARDPEGNVSVARAGLKIPAPR